MATTQDHLYAIAMFACFGSGVTCSTPLDLDSVLTVVAAFPAEGFAQKVLACDAGAIAG
ncbi:MAG TPA: hypothetical protein VFR78_17220 [Pyrinomonadaceae bacterium]|nr:hypothetical protein [Pyrinomonadaceae bacterium]